MAGNNTILLSHNYSNSRHVKNRRIITSYLFDFTPSEIANLFVLWSQACPWWYAGGAIIPYSAIVSIRLIGVEVCWRAGHLKGPLACRTPQNSTTTPCCMSAICCSTSLGREVTVRYHTAEHCNAAAIGASICSDTDPLAQHRRAVGFGTTANLLVHGGHNPATWWA